MNRLLKTIVTTYVLFALTPKVIKGACIITEVVVRGVISKLDDVLYGENDLEKKRERRHLRKSYQSYNDYKFNK